ncbi:MAG: virulence factor [Gaiellales bacterium]
MAEYRITRWREIPSLVTARAADGQTVRVPLPDRFQEAIDELAMNTGATGSDAYLEGWVQEDWQSRDGDAGAVAADVARELEESYPPSDLAALATGGGT